MLFFFTEGSHAAKLSTRVKLFLCRLFMLILVRELHTGIKVLPTDLRVCLYVCVWVSMDVSVNVRVKHFIVSIYTQAWKADQRVPLD